MKILIFYAKYGGGHLSAASAIKEAITNNYKEHEVEMIDCMEYANKAVNDLTIELYNGMARRLPRMWGSVYRHSNKGPIASFSKSANRLLAFKLKSLIQDINPDIIISTHPFSTQMCSFLKKHKKIDKPIVNILTDYKMHEQWLVKHKYIDLFFVSNEEMKNNLIEYGIDKEKIYAVGLPISNRFSIKYKREEILKEFNLKENKTTILFFAGGKYGLATKKVYEFIEDLICDFDNIQVVAISGKNEKIFDKFNQIVDKYKRQEDIKIIEFTDKVPELMSVADLVITKPRRNNNFRKHGNAEYL